MKNFLKTTLLLSLLQTSLLYAAGDDLRAEREKCHCDCRSLFRGVMSALFKPVVTLETERGSTGSVISLHIYEGDVRPSTRLRTPLTLTDDDFDGFVPSPDLTTEAQRKQVGVYVQKSLQEKFGSLRRLLNAIGKQEN